MCCRSCSVRQTPKPLFATSFLSRRQVRQKTLKCPAVKHWSCSCGLRGSVHENFEVTVPDFRHLSVRSPSWVARLLFRSCSLCRDYLWVCFRCNPEPCNSCITLRIPSELCTKNHTRLGPDALCVEACEVLRSHRHCKVDCGHLAYAPYLLGAQAFKKLCRSRMMRSLNPYRTPPKTQSLTEDPSKKISMVASTICPQGRPPPKALSKGAAPVESTPISSLGCSDRERAFWGFFCWRVLGLGFRVWTLTLAQGRQGFAQFRHA